MEPNLIVADSTDDGLPDYVLDPDAGLWHDLQRCYVNILHEATFDEAWLSFNLDCDEGWSWFSVLDPFEGNMRITDVYNSDGEHIPFNRYWTLDGQIFFIDLVVPGTIYTVEFGPPVAPDLSLPPAYSNWQPTYPLEGDSLSLSLGVYNAGEEDAGRALAGPLRCDRGRQYAIAASDCATGRRAWTTESHHSACGKRAAAWLQSAGGLA